MKILLPVDGSTESLDAVRHALQLIRDGLRARLVLANVQEPASLYELLRAHDAEVIEGVTQAAGVHSLEEANALCVAAGVPCEQELETGDPAHMLHDIAERQGCELVIMGARGKGGTRGTRLGSVAHAMLHDAILPVTIVGAHPAAPASGADEA